MNFIFFYLFNGYTSYGGFTSGYVSSKLTLTYTTPDSGLTYT